MERRLTRSRTDKMIAGVCGGLGEYLDVDPTLIRLMFVLAVLAGFGSGIVIYIIMALVMPYKDQLQPAAPPTPDPAADHSLNS